MVVYNESVQWSPKTRWSLLFLLGLLALLGLPAHWWMILSLVCLWVIADILFKQQIIRSINALLLLAVVFGWGGFLMMHLDSLSTVVVPYRSWSESSRIIATRQSGPIKLRCIGCVRPSDLEPLHILLNQQRVELNNVGSTVYVIVPPVSAKHALIPNSVSTIVGPIKIAWPLN
jgi:hypothetical protein